MNKNTWKVYVHTNKLNGKKYVGITSRDVNVRWKDGKGYKENTHLDSAIKKYGWDNFDHDVIYDNLSEYEAKSKEAELILLWGTNDRRIGYNMTLGGEGTSGCYPSKRTREILSNLRKRENLSEETLRRRSEGLRGRKFSEEHKRKIGESNSKPVNMFDKDGAFIATYPSMKFVEENMGINHSKISSCCTGKRKTAGGYKWSYA